MSDIKSVANNEIVGKDDLKKPSFQDAKVKDTLTNPEIQRVLKQMLEVPEIVIVKKLGNASPEHHTQKVEAMCGKTIEDAFAIKFTISDETRTYFLDPVKAINKKYRIIDYTLGLEANMSGKDFKGYSAVGFKLIVNKIEGV